MNKSSTSSVTATASKNPSSPITPVKIGILSSTLFESIALPRTSLYISVNKTRASTVKEFKALLAQLYSSGNPLKVYLVRVSPTKNPLSEEVQTALSNLKLYQDLNNIAIDGGSMNFIYNKSLLRSLEEKDEKIDGLQSQIDEIKSLLSSTSTASLLAENLAKDNESEVI